MASSESGNGTFSNEQLILLQQQLLPALQKRAEFPSKSRGTFDNEPKSISV